MAKFTEIDSTTSVSAQSSEKFSLEALTSLKQANLQRARSMHQNSVPSASLSFDNPYIIAKNTATSVENSREKPNEDLPIVAYERSRLDALAEAQIKDPKQLTQFREDLKKFESRVSAKKLNDLEVPDTYKHLERLLNTEEVNKWSLPMSERVRLAKQVLSQAADPTRIDQGAHNTCNVTAVEVRTYSLHPSNAARLVSEVAITGTYKSSEPSPTSINVDSRSLLPDAESRSDPRKDGERSFATQIFNVTAVNLVHRRDKTGNVYGNDSMGGDEYLYNRRLGQTVSKQPDLDDDQIVNAYDIVNATDRKREPLVMLDADDNVAGKGKNIVRVKSEEELMQKLVQAKDSGQLPVIVGVDAHVEPFWTDSGHGSAGGSSGGHVVNVYDLTSDQPPKVLIDNQWGSKSDHLGANAVSLRQLFIAMHEPNSAEKLQQKDVNEDRKNGKFDACKELELVRLHHFNKVGQLAKHSANERLNEDKLYSQRLLDTVNKVAAVWSEQLKSGKVDSAEHTRVHDKIADLTNDPNLSGPGRVSLLNLRREKNLIDATEYGGAITDLMGDLTSLKDIQPAKTKRENIEYSYKHQEYSDTLIALKATVKNVPEKERDKMLDQSLNDAENSDRWKFALLRTVHDSQMLSEEKFISRAGKLFRELRAHQEKGAYKQDEELFLAALDQSKKLLMESTPQVAHRIEAAAKKL